MHLGKFIGTSTKTIVEQLIFRIIVEQNGIIKVRANKISCAGARASFELSMEFLVKIAHAIYSRR